MQSIILNIKILISTHYIKLRLFIPYSLHNFFLIIRQHFFCILITFFNFFRWFPINIVIYITFYLIRFIFSFIFCIFRFRFPWLLAYTIKIIIIFLFFSSSKSTFLNSFLDFSILHFWYILVIIRIIDTYIIVL